MQQDRRGLGGVGHDGVADAGFEHEGGGFGGLRDGVGDRREPDRSARGAGRQGEGDGDPGGIEAHAVAGEGEVAAGRRRAGEAEGETQTAGGGSLGERHRVFTRVGRLLGGIGDGGGHAGERAGAGRAVERFAPD